MINVKEGVRKHSFFFKPLKKNKGRSESTISTFKMTEPLRFRTNTTKIYKKIDTTKSSYQHSIVNNLF